MEPLLFDYVLLPLFFSSLSFLSSLLAHVNFKKNKIHMFFYSFSLNSSKYDFERENRFAEK